MVLPFNDLQLSRRQLDRANGEHGQGIKNRVQQYQAATQRQQDRAPT
jgi:hypothetical protein